MSLTTQQKKDELTKHYSSLKRKFSKKSGKSAKENAQICTECLEILKLDLSESGVSSVYSDVFGK